MTAKGKAEEQQSFEEIYKRLEETVSKLEQGNLSLEDSIALYEEGVTLARRCQELLQDAEQRVTRLQEQFADGMGTVRDGGADYGEPEEMFEDEDLPVE